MGVAIPQLAPASQDRVSGAQVIDGSLKFDRSSSQNLSRTFSAGNQKTWTWSGWIKRNTFGTTQSLLLSGDTYIQYYSLTDTLYTNLRSASTNYFINYANKYRDPSWYHVVVAVDTTEATSSNRQKVYVNGVQLIEAGGLGLNYPPQDENTAFNSAAVHYIGGTNYFDGAMSQVYFIDGQALEPENFGFTDPLTNTCLLYTSPSPRDAHESRMPSSA